MAHNISDKRLSMWHNKPIERLTLGDMTLEWVTNFKYLGLMFNSGRSLHFDSSCVKRKYYGSCNSILGHCKYAEECF